MITKEQVKNALDVLTEFKKQAHDVYKTLRENNAQYLFNANEHFDSFGINISDCGLLAEFVKIDWDYDSDADRICDYDTTDCKWYFTPKAEIFFMDKEHQLKWIADKFEEKRKEEERKAEVLRKAAEEEKKLAEDLEKVKQTDEYQTYLKLKDKFSSVERRD